MSVYAIGDVQGCHDALLRLLDRVQFDPARDQLWFAGDLVNRGPDSLATLRFVMSLGEAAVSVLGNHDLHLLARAAGGRGGKQDTLHAVLVAEDREILLDWLRHCPLLVEAPGWAMAHAGIAPVWTLDEARKTARAIEARLRAADYQETLKTMYGDEPRRYSPFLSAEELLRYGLNAFTRMRYCEPDGAFDFKAKGPPGSQPEPLLPWFALPGREALEAEVIFGHWSALGRVHWPEHRVWGLDTGAVWGGQLTALNLDNRGVYAVDCPENASLVAPRGD